MTMVFLYLLSLILILLIPSFIVIIWRRRPILAFVFGSIILCLAVIAPGIFRTFQAMMIYGTGDPQLMAGGISAALTEGLLSLPILLPVLALIQWFARRPYKRKMNAKPVDDTFS